MKTTLLLALAVLLLGCGSTTPQILTAAKVSLSASHELVERLCKIGLSQAHTDQEREDADLRCLALRASYEATSAAVQAWSVAAEEPVCKPSAP